MSGFLGNAGLFIGAPRTCYHLSEFRNKHIPRPEKSAITNFVRTLGAFRRSELVGLEGRNPACDTELGQNRARPVDARVSRRLQPFERRQDREGVRPRHLAERGVVCGQNGLSESRLGQLAPHDLRGIGAKLCHDRGQLASRRLRGENTGPFIVNVVIVLAVPGALLIRALAGGA